jgi:multiple sugar transport system ATP-binding protein
VSVNVQKLRKQYGRHVAVNDVDIDILDGEFFVMLGPSGCGKTTTLRMIAGLDVPSAGRVWIRGRDVTGMEPRHRDIAMAFQDFGLYPNMTVFQNVQFPLKVRKMPEAERKRRVEDVAGRLGIDMLLDRKPGQISGGQRQRVSLARALVRSPHVFLMDEPLSNLDAKLRATMRKEIKQLVSNLGITTIYVTHDQVEAMSMADRIGVMSGGNMIQVDSPLVIYERPKTRFVAQFMGSPPMNLFARASAGSAPSIYEHLAALLPETAARQLASESVLIGIRPEYVDLLPRPEGDVPSAAIEFIEPLGSVTNVYLRSGEERFIAVVDRCAFAVGDMVGLSIHPDNIRLVGEDSVR